MDLAHHCHSPLSFSLVLDHSLGRSISDFCHKIFLYSVILNGTFVLCCWLVHRCLERISLVVLKETSVTLQFFLFFFFLLFEILLMIQSCYSVSV